MVSRFIKKKRIWPELASSQPETNIKMKTLLIVKCYQGSSIHHSTSKKKKTEKVNILLQLPRIS